MRFLRRLLFIAPLLLTTGCGASRFTGAGVYSPESRFDVNIDLTFHVKRGEKRSKAELIGRLVGTANTRMIGRGLRIVRVNVKDDLHESSLRYDAPRGEEDGETLDSFYEVRSSDPKTIHVFLVDEIIDMSGELRDGILVGLTASRYTSDRCVRLMAVTPRAQDLTLAHEIGHFYRLDHVSDPINVMYSVAEFGDMNGNVSRSRAADFTPWQMTVIRANAAVHKRKCLE